jgi:hypothetical protein
MGIKFTVGGIPKSQFRYALILIDYESLDISYVYEETLKLVLVEGDNLTEINQSGPDKDKELVITEVYEQGTFALITDIDFDSDADRDGAPYSEDAFPFDPAEWLDTDDDTIGDNADTDDDNDGYNDTLELAAGSNEKDASSVPPDTDQDGFLDVNDLDDDNDGMPDDWEQANFLDPLNSTDAGDDPDKDGYTNLEEFQKGTNPRASDKEASDGPLLDQTEVWILVFAVLLIGVFIIIIFVIKRMPQKEAEEDEDEDEDEDWDYAVKKKRGKGRKRRPGKKKKKAKKKNVMEWDDDDEMDVEDSFQEAELEDDEIEDVEDEWDDEEEQDEDIEDDENLVDDADIDADEDDLESFECTECGEVLPMSATKCPECKTEFED